MSILHDFEMLAIDFTQICIQVPADTKVFMYIPLGFKVDKNIVLKLKKNVYSL